MICLLHYFLPIGQFVKLNHVSSVQLRRFVRALASPRSRECQSVVNGNCRETFADDVDQYMSSHVVDDRKRLRLTCPRTKRPPTDIMTSNLGRAHGTRESLSSSCSQVVLVYLQPFSRNALCGCLAIENRKKH